MNVIQIHCVYRGQIIILDVVRVSPSVFQGVPAKSEFLLFFSCKRDRQLWQVTNPQFVHGHLLFEQQVRWAFFQNTGVR